MPVAGEEICYANGEKSLKRVGKIYYENGEDSARAEGKSFTNVKD